MAKSKFDNLWSFDRVYKETMNEVSAIITFYRRGLYSSDDLGKAFLQIFDRAMCYATDTKSRNELASGLIGNACTGIADDVIIWACAWAMFGGDEEKARLYVTPVTDAIWDSME